jgi:catechol 2,3-dioxygenase-like lactoylglutathione lyase family enzyme
MPEGEEEAARQFYGVILGLEEIEKPSNLERRGGVWFTLSTRQIHLGVQADFRPATKAHVAFVVEDLDLIRSRLQQAGCPIVSDEPLPGYERFYSADPFGNRLEFLVPTRSSNQLVYVETGG